MSNEKTSASAAQATIKPDPREACANCRCFSLRSDIKDDENPVVFGNCRLNPPVRGDVTSRVSVFPIVTADTWCAQHRFAVKPTAAS